MEDLKEWIRQQAKAFRPYTERDLKGKTLEDIHFRAGRWEMLCSVSHRFFGETPDKL